MGPDGAVTRPARLLVQFEAAGAHRWGWRWQQPEVERRAGSEGLWTAAVGTACAGGWLGRFLKPWNSVSKIAGSRATVPSRP